MARASIEIDPDHREQERRRVIRIPVDAVAAYRAVGMRDYELCEVREVSTRAMVIVLDQRLPSHAVVSLAVQHTDEDCPRRLHARVLRIERDRDRWKHVVLPASSHPWPADVIIDIACSTRGSSYVRRLAEWAGQ